MIESELRDLKKLSTKFGAVIFVICVVLFSVALIRQQQRFEFTGKCVASLICIAFPAFMGWLYYQCGSNHLAFKFMAKATEEYLVNNRGTWPNSFDALASHAEKISDLKWAAARVRFDYDADTNKLARQDPRDFDGIRYNPPSFVPNDETADLLAIVRKCVCIAG